MASMAAEMDSTLYLRRRWLCAASAADRETVPNLGSVSDVIRMFRKLCGVLQNRLPSGNALGLFCRVFPAQMIQL